MRGEKLKYVPIAWATGHVISRWRDDDLHTMVNRCVIVIPQSTVLRWYTTVYHRNFMFHWTIFTVRRYALHGICCSNSVCPSVRLSVRLSVTLVDCVHMVRPTIMISSPYGSPIILVSGDITFTPKFEGGHPELGRWMRVGWVRIGDFRPISRRISETVRDTTKVTINH